LVGEYIPTTGFVFGVSPFGEAKLFSDEGARRFNDEFTTEDPTTGGRRHAEDALLALTAEDEAAVLVTRDVGLTRKARKQGIDVTTPADLAARLK
jgi:hypothetical protein